MDPTKPSPADPEERDRVLGECLDDFTRRRGLGEPVSVEDYRARLGADFGELLEAVATTDLLDSVLTLRPAASTFPRTFGRYTLLAQLGRGSVGVVYDALDRELGRRVALKVLRPGFDTDPAAVERFRSEARHCALVRHPSIVVVHEAGLAEGQHYYTMERVEGHTLASLVRGDRAPGLPAPPALPALLRGLADVADALGALHAATAVHRDVKPSNLMVQPDGRFVLADFGLARTVDSVRMTRTGQMMGTLLYSSPEQVLGRRDAVDARSDVYGLGATLYEAVSGRPPFDTEDAGELMKRILEQRPSPPSQVAAKDPARAPVPAAVDRVVLKCLEKRPEDRYPSMAALRADLLAVAEGRPPEGRPVGAVRRVVRKRGRMLGVLVALLCAGGVGVAWQRSRPIPTSLYTFPRGAELFEGSRSLGTSNLTASLSRGSHTFTARLRGFRSETWEVDVPRDPLLPNVVRLLPADGRPPGESRDPYVIKAYAEDAARPLFGIDAVDRVRAGAGSVLLALWPRRKTQVSDVRVLVFEVDGEQLPMAREIVVLLEVGRSPLAEVARVAVPKGRDRVTVTAPAGVAVSLQAGMRFRWVVEARDEGGIPLARTEADGELVPTAQPEPIPASETLPPGAVAAAEAIHWLNRDLAAKAATLLLRPQDTERGAYGDLLLLTALNRLGLEDSALAESARGRLEAASARDEALVPALRK